MIDLTQLGSVEGLAAFLVVFVQVVKTVLPLGEAEKRWIPLATVLLGVGLAMVVGLALGRVATGADWLSWGFGGFLAGAQGVGLYESVIKSLKWAVRSQTGTGSAPTGPTISIS